ncbi:MAG: hypothetical protein ABI863_10565 [Ginsengibacter sp.]
MIKNYLKIAFRNLSKNRPYAFVNMLGLFVAIESCVLIGLFIQDEGIDQRTNTTSG